MATTKTREITITESKGAFSLFKKSSTSKKDYDFEGISSLRHLLSNEKARMLNVIKTQNPNSISDDIKLLERYGFIDLLEEKTKNRVRHKPEVVVDTITIHIKV